MWVRSLGREDALEEGMATRSRILAWRIPWTEEPGRLQSMGSQKTQTRLSGWAFMHSGFCRMGTSGADLSKISGEPGQVGQPALKTS